MYQLLRPLLFALDAEKSHDLSMGALSLAASLSPITSLLRHFYQPPNNPTEVASITLRNPVGLAAGLDKDATAIKAFEAMGFGFVEVGTVTPLPQVGNDKPRLFRLVNDNAIINRMGFNSCGLDTFVRNLEKSKKDCSIPIGVNLGKNKDTPNDEAFWDYRKGIAATYHLADYLTINISSPNTPDLRALQHQHALTRLIDEVLDERDMHTRDNGWKPVFFKIAPDNSEEELAAIIETANTCGIDGIIATNTTVSRPSLNDNELASEIGGLSGPPLHQKSVSTIQALSVGLNEGIALIGAGGISSSADSADFFKNGCSALQLYSSLIYQGPSVIQRALDGKYPA